MTNYIGPIEGRRATSGAVLRQALSGLKDVRPVANAGDTNLLAAEVSDA
jgi:hypothetical protein